MTLATKLVTFLTLTVVGIIAVPTRDAVGMHHEAVVHTKWHYFCVKLQQMY